MKRWWQLYEFHASLLIIGLIAAVMFESLFLRSGLSHTTLSLTSGIAATAMLLHKRRIFPYVFIGTIVGYYLKAELVLGFHWNESILFALGKAVIFLFILELSRMLIFNSKLISILRTHRVEALFLFISIAAVAALSGSLVNFIFYAFLGPTTINGLLQIYTTFFSVFSGVVIFTPLLYLSTREIHTGLIKRSTLKYIIYGIFLVVFSLLNYLLIIGVFEFMFSRHLYIITGFFIAAALLFSYRFLFAITLIFFTFYGVFYHDPLWSDATYIRESGTIYAFIFITMIVSLMIKEYVETQHQQHIELKQMNRQLQKTLDYVHKFFTLSKKIITNGNGYDGLYAKETFELTNMLFEEADASFGYFETNGEIDVIVSNNYPKKKIPLLYELHNADLFRNRDVVFIRSIENRLKSLYENATILNKYTYLKKGKRVYIVFRFSINKLLIIGLDYYKKPQLLGTSDIRKIRDFNALLNKLFLKQQISKQNRMLKDDIIRAFVRTLDLYDKYTKGHSEDVAMISKEISIMLEKDDKFINDIYWAGLLHDIGKLGVDYNILNKDGKLEDNEYVHIQNHVLYSYNVLSNNEDLSDIATMVRDHHERIDGKGYPRGLSETDISMGGKIISVADAVATMATNRPYRKRLTKEKIKSELQTHSGTQFSPKIVEVMITLLDQNILDAIK